MARSRSDSASAHYSRSYRSYPGGRPLERRMDKDTRGIWSGWITEAFGEVPGRTKTARLDELCNALGVIRGRREAYDRHQVRRYLDGRDGVNPDMAFAIGEALFDARVPWASGPLSLAFASTFLPHAVACIGWTLKEGPSEVLKRMWTGLMIVTQENFRSPQHPDPDHFNSLKGALTWQKDAHELVRGAWAAWWHTREDSTAMPDVFQQYLALCRIPISTQEGLLARSTARGAILHWMKRARATWSSFGVWFRSDDEEDLWSAQNMCRIVQYDEHDESDGRAADEMIRAADEGMAV